MKPPFPKMWEI